MILDVPVVGHAWWHLLTGLGASRMMSALICELLQPRRSRKISFLLAFRSYSCKPWRRSVRIQVLPRPPLRHTDSSLDNEKVVMSVVICHLRCIVLCCNPRARSYTGYKMPSWGFLSAIDWLSPKSSSQPSNIAPDPLAHGLHAEYYHTSRPLRSSRGSLRL